MNLNFPLLSTALAAAVFALPPAAAAEHDAAAILAGARMAAALVELDTPLTGEIRQGARKVDLVLFLKGQDVQFQFSEKRGPWQVFAMRIGEDRVRLWETIDGRSVDFPDGKLVEPILGTDLTYEDLAMRFLYWPNPVHEGIESVAGQPCHKIRINKPAGMAGRYESVYVWVHEKFGALMRVRGHDRSGALIKEFEVEDVVQIAKDVWTLRKMKVSTSDPARGRRSSVSSVNFDTPNRQVPRGLR